MREHTFVEQRRLYLLTRAVIARHYGKPLTLAPSRARCCSSPRQLQRAYALFGESTFREDLIARRMQVAAALLLEQPAIPIRDIARLVGYRQAPHFAKAFRRRYGVTPARFRAMHWCRRTARGAAGARHGAVVRSGAAGADRVSDRAGRRSNVSVARPPQPPSGELQEPGGALGRGATERRLRNGLISLAIFSVLVDRAAARRARPALGGERMTRRQTRVDSGCGILSRLLSCAGYVVLFELVFGQDCGAHALAPFALRARGQLGRLGRAAWAGSRSAHGCFAPEGLSIERIAKRSVAMFLLTSAVNVVAVAVIGRADVAGADSRARPTRC